MKNSKPNSPNPSFLDTLAEAAHASVSSGYYNVEEIALDEYARCNLTQSIRRCSKNPVIAEVKFASPSQGVIQSNGDPAKIAQAMTKGGAVGLSVLTEPKHFGGSLENLVKVRNSTSLPVLMKDIVVSYAQIDAAHFLGADAILLIIGLFEAGKCEMGLHEAVIYAHLKGLQVLLEVHNREEFNRAVETDADLIGVNNRDLATLSVDLSTTVKILQNTSRHGKLVVSESGIGSAEDLRFLKQAGADAYLVGTSVMKSEDIESKVRELVEA
ncbi:MAG: indole-3-glycerol-phosphate synthase [Thaumarchaeota archaeon]|nr:indole-3-glycerol-phosphate synthase [Nitrososphaerota archaeon]